MQLSRSTQNPNLRQPFFREAFLENGAPRVDFGIECPIVTNDTTCPAKMPTEKLKARRRCAGTAASLRDSCVGSPILFRGPLCLLVLQLGNARDQVGDLLLKLLHSCSLRL